MNKQEHIADQEAKMQYKPAPKRKIVSECIRFPKRTRSGIITLVELECWDVDKVNASEKRRGWIHCFDCFYEEKRKLKEMQDD